MKWMVWKMYLLLQTWDILGIRARLRWATKPCCLVMSSAAWLEKLFSVEADRCLEPQGQPFINGCFNGMIANLYIENGCFTKHPLINGCLGFQVVVRVVRQVVAGNISAFWGMRSQKKLFFPGKTSQILCEHSENHFGCKFDISWSCWKIRKISTIKFN